MGTVDWITSGDDVTQKREIMMEARRREALGGGRRWAVVVGVGVALVQLARMDGYREVRR